MTRIGFAYNRKPAAVAPDSAETDQYAEWDTAETIDAVAGALSSLGQVIHLEATADFPEQLRRERPEIVFNIAEGLHGPAREAHVPAICEFFGVPYSGSDPFTLALCLDKARTKEILAYHGIPTAPFAVVRDAAGLDRLRRELGRPRAGAARALHLPVFAKPLHEGSSKGITERNYCDNPDTLAEQTVFLLETYQQPVLIEQWLPGAEFTVGLLGNGSGTRVLPLVGMNFGALPPGARPIYGYEAKWVWDRPENPLAIFECPARISDSLRRQIDEVARSAYLALGCRDWSRVDVRLDADGVPNVVEVNPLPGILPNPADNSCLPKAARAAGLSYDALIQTCLRHAADRAGIPVRELRAGGTAHSPRPLAAAVEH